MNKQFMIIYPHKSVLNQCKSTEPSKPWSLIFRTMLECNTYTNKLHHAMQNKRFYLATFL